jgi:hypothetical protein
MLCGSLFSDKLCVALQRFCNMAVNGLLPSNLSPFLAGAKLIPLEKPGGGIRPIAVGEVLRRLVAKVLIARFQPGIADNLRPLQLGVNTPQATELIAHSARLFLQDHNNEGAMLQIDFKNAFNSIDRITMLDTIWNVCPSLAPWAQWCYGHPSNLIVSPQCSLLSSEGVQQGDPLGPLFFALTIQKLVESLNKINDVFWSCWYLDDGIITGSIEALESCLQVIQQSSNVGLKLNYSKCCLSHIPLVHQMSCQSSLSRVPVSVDRSVKVLGIPIGSPEFVANTLSDVGQKMSRLSAAILKLPDSHVAFTILRMAGSHCRVNHILRAVPLELTDSWSTEVDELIVSTAEAIMGGSTKFSVETNVVTIVVWWYGFDEL